MSQAKLTADGLVKEYGDFKAVNDISFTIQEGEFFSLLGPSGCGKTTTLRMLAGFEQPTEGTISIDEEVINEKPPYNRDVGMVFQSYALFPHKSVGENVGFGLKMDNVPSDEREERVDDILELVGLPGFQDRSPGELSGGQQQRVALARALVIEPSVLLLDEPLANLDLKLRKEMQFELKRIQTELEITTVYVTHDQEEALSLSDEILVMNEGKSEQIASPPEVYNNPANEFVASFMGESNILSGSIVSQNEATVDVDLHSTEQDSISISQEAVEQMEISDNDRISLSLRSEDLEIVGQAKADGTGIDGTVNTKTFQGKATKFVVDIGSEEILVEAPGKQSQDQFDVGDQVNVQWDENDCLVLRG